MKTKVLAHEDAGEDHLKGSTNCTSACRIATKMGLSASRGSTRSAASESSFTSEKDSSEGYESDDTSSQCSLITSHSLNIYHRQFKNATLHQTVLELYQLL